LAIEFTCFAQSEISNFWEYGDDALEISNVINDKNDSYMIYKKDVKQGPKSSGFGYSSILYLEANGTFYSRNSAPCGNHCTYYSEGIFKKIDETHIQLQIKKSAQSGLCPGGKKVNRKRRDLGIFEIKAYEDRYDLIKINNKIFTNKKQ